jgi:integrase
MEEFLAHREAHGYSSHDYEEAFKFFDKYCVSSRIKSDALTQELVIAWLNADSVEDRSPYWKALCIRQFAEYLQTTGREAYVLPNGFFAKAPKKETYILTDDEIHRFFKASDDIKSAKRRPYDSVIAPIIFRLIYTCGLRPNEARELECKNINLDTGEIFIAHNKSRKQRVVVMSDEMLGLCKQYCSLRSSFADDCDFYFPLNGRPYTNKEMLRLFGLCWKAANPEKSLTELPQISPYNLRHRFASAVLIRWIDAGKDLKAMLPYLQAYMGHDKLSDTAYYIHLLPENLLKSKTLNLAGLETLLPEVSVWEE